MTYGNFAEQKVETGSKRSNDVLLTALERCEQLEQRLQEACQLIGRLNIKLREKEDFVEILRGRYE